MRVIPIKTVNYACKVLQNLSLAAKEPRWSLAKRQAGLIAARHLPQPTRQDEAWRLSDLDHFVLPETYLYPSKDFKGSGSVPARFSVLDGSGERKACPAGITGLSIDEALASVASLESFFFLDQRHQRDYYGALNAAWRNGGAWLDIPRGTAVSETVKIEHSPTMAYYFPHSVLRIESGSQASVIEHFCGDDAERQTNATIEINLAENTSLQYALVLDWGQRTNALTNVHVYMQEGASANIFIISLGGNDNKVFFQSDIAGSNASSQVYGLTYARGTQNFEVSLLQKHHTRCSVSDVLFHCALDDNARSVFAGNIDVCGAAQKSDAYQKNRNLLLSPGARAYSQPQLEIIANDVRCTHGANFTSYDPEQEFYLQSRGIRPEEARRLIVSGFLHEIAGHFPNDTGRLYLGRLLNRHLGEEWLGFSDDQPFEEQ